MQIQFHPASRRGEVRTVSLSAAGERLLIGAACGLLALAGSVWLTVPMVSVLRARQERAVQLTVEIAKRRSDWSRVIEEARKIRRRSLDRGDLLNRIGFLYAVSPRQWPQILSPERQAISGNDSERVAAELDLYFRGLERALALVAQRDQEDRGLADRLPAIMPIRNEVSEPSAFFGPRRSPWTGEEEFFLGVDLAAPAGSPVVAPAAGSVVFAGVVRRTTLGSFWRLGNVVVLSHDEGNATVFGHLSKVVVRRGQRVVRGQPLGAVGSTGWALAPQLHYEYWRRNREGENLRPTDPLFTTLDQRFGRAFSLEQMESTSAPGPLDPLPGIQVGAEQAADRDRSQPPHAPARRRANRQKI